ncbi:hypothetical protein TcWFU_008226 [Taenia crassiceps]|uniref:Uncharacterized protein n=1 Tax=Taenia crassiceps TaxID=6207 RepID=A0ABR4Q0C7_9CEST
MPRLVLLCQCLCLIIVHHVTSVRPFKLDTEPLLKPGFSYGFLPMIGASICFLAVIAMVTISCCKKKDPSVEEKYVQNQHTYLNTNDYPQKQRYPCIDRPLPAPPTIQQTSYVNEVPHILNLQYANELPTYENSRGFLTQDAGMKGIVSAGLRFSSCESLQIKANPEDILSAKSPTMHEYDSPHATSSSLEPKAAPNEEGPKSEDSRQQDLKSESQERQPASQDSPAFRPLFSEPSIEITESEFEHGTGVPYQTIIMTVRSPIHGKSL